MSEAAKETRSFRLSLFEGLLPIQGSRVPAEIIAGLTLAALAIPEVLGYTKIAGTPPITGLYTMLIPALLALALVVMLQRRRAAALVPAQA